MTLNEMNDNSWISALKNDDYKVIDCIDYGSFSDVFTVKKNDDGKILALKKIVSRCSIKDDQTVLSEIRCLYRLRHRHVIQLKDVVVSNYTACIIMEYAPLGNLQDYSKQSDRFSNSFIFQTFGQLLSALSFCHSKNIAHRDLNPSNVLVLSSTIVKFGDFGLGFDCIGDNGKHHLCDEYLGQTAYLAPEVLINCPFHPKPADVWSLGCILYFMCFNSKPFDGSKETILSAQLHHGLELPEVTLSSLFTSTLCYMCSVEITDREAVESVSKKWLSCDVDDIDELKV